MLQDDIFKKPDLKSYVITNEKRKIDLFLFCFLHLKKRLKFRLKQLPSGLFVVSLQ